jgi:acyl dehydratase
MKTTQVRQWTVGDVFTDEVATGLTRTQIVQYAGASGDYNPLHTDEVFAREVAGYPSVFAHGMLTMGMTGKLIVRLAGPWGVLRYGVRFKAQVWPGDTLIARATVSAIREEDGRQLVDLDLSTVNQHGQEVLAGTATISPGAAPYTMTTTS